MDDKTYNEIGIDRMAWKLLHGGGFWIQEVWFCFLCDKIWEVTQTACMCFRTDQTKAKKSFWTFYMLTGSRVVQSDRG